MKLNIYQQELIQRVKALSDGEKRLVLKESFKDDERMLWDEIYRRNRVKDRTIEAHKKAERMC